LGRKSAFASSAKTKADPQQLIIEYISKVSSSTSSSFFDLYVPLTHDGFPVVDGHKKATHTHKGESKVAIIWRESIEQADELVSVKILSTIEKKRKKRWTCIQCKSIAESIAFFLDDRGDSSSQQRER
jgi:hypothetical protein